MDKVRWEEREEREAGPRQGLAKNRGAQNELYKHLGIGWRGKATWASTHPPCSLKRPTEEARLTQALFARLVPLMVSF